MLSIWNILGYQYCTSSELVLGIKVFINLTLMSKKITDKGNEKCKGIINSFEKLQVNVRACSLFVTTM